MTISAPRTSAALTLPLRDAAALWNAVLRRQGLGGGPRLDTLFEVSTATAGLPVARPLTPFAAVLARCAEPTSALALFGPADDVVVVRGMRKTAHLLPLTVAADAHAATLRYRMTDTDRMCFDAEIHRDTLAKVIRQICLVLGDGPLRPDEIETALVGPRFPRTSVRVALKTAWEQGLLTYLNTSGCWNTEQRAFALTEDLHPDLDLDVDPTEASTRLVRFYFEHYGPATVTDASWWSGLSRRAVVAAMNSDLDGGVEWAELTTGWCDSPLYTRHEQVDHLLDAAGEGCATTTPSGDGGLHFLAPEDPVLKAYTESRARMLGRAQERDVFAPNGDALPSVLLRGQVVATWAWDRTSRTVHATAFANALPRNHTRRLDAAAEQFTEGLRAGWRDRSGATVDLVSPDQLALAF